MLHNLSLPKRQKRKHKEQKEIPLQESETEKKTLKVTKKKKNQLRNEVFFCYER